MCLQKREILSKDRTRVVQDERRRVPLNYDHAIAFPMKIFSTFKVKYVENLENMKSTFPNCMCFQQYFQWKYFQSNNTKHIFRPSFHFHWKWKWKWSNQIPPKFTTFYHLIKSTNLKHSFIEIVGFIIQWLLWCPQLLHSFQIYGLILFYHLNHLFHINCTYLKRLKHLI